MKPHEKFMFYINKIEGYSAIWKEDLQVVEIKVDYYGVSYHQINCNEVDYYHIDFYPSSVQLEKELEVQMKFFSKEENCIDFIGFEYNPYSIYYALEAISCIVNSDSHNKKEQINYYRVGDWSLKHEFPPRFRYWLATYKKDKDNPEWRTDLP